MESNEEIEKRKFSEFKKDIRNEKELIEKIQEMYDSEFDEMFQDILISSKEDFLDNISNNINTLLTDIYSEQCLSDETLEKILTDFDNQVEKDYNFHYEILNKAFKNFERDNRRGKLNENSFLSNFRKHCAETDDIAYHNCQNSLSKFYQIEENGEIKYVICQDCQKVYLSSMILCNCSNCNEDYFSSILNKNEDKNLLPATWKKYHCEKVINEKMKCVKCHSTLYLNLKTNMLVCLNFKCNFTSKPERILWTCTVCKTDFKSDAIVYNPLENENIKKIIRQTIFLKQKAHPNKLPCCKLNIFFTNFYHKSDCRGTLYFGELNNNIIVVCERCKAFNFYDRFIWTCPKCGSRFRDKKELKKINVNSNNIDQDFRRKSLEVLASPIKKKNNDDENDNNNIRKNAKTNIYKNDNEEEEEEKENNSINLRNKSNIDENDRSKKLREERERRRREREERIEKEKKEKEEKEKKEREDRLKEREERRERRERERKEKEEREKKEKEKEEKNNNKNRLNAYDRIINRRRRENEEENNSNKKTENSSKNENLEEEEIHIKQSKTTDNSHTNNLNMKTLQNQIKKILNDSKLPKFDINDYTLYKQIGEGSYGVIYQAYNNNDKKKYALKKIIAHDIDELEGFEEEFELVYVCDHPNVMKIYGICVNILDSTTYALYVLMELALGDWNDEIKKHLSVRKNYKEDDLINILKQIINALLFMQTKMKIAHRDIKPQNILVFKNKIYKVADFGEAKEAKIAKQLNTLRGTELYMSPVLYDGLKKDKDDVTHNPYKSDVFSLGFCLMYAASLNFNIIYEVRDVTDTNRIDKILHKHFKNKYTEKFIQVLLLMLEIDEGKRCDFVELNDYIYKNYP